MALPYDYSTMLLFHKKYRDLEMNHFGEPAYMKHIRDGWPATFDLGWSQFKPQNMETKPQEVEEAPKMTRKEKVMMFLFKTNKCFVVFSKIVYITFVILTLLASLAVMIFTVNCSAISRDYSISESSRAAYMILVAITAGITVTTLGYSILAMCKSSPRALHIVGALLFACTVLHIAIALTCVEFTASNENALYASLQQTLVLAKRGWPDEYRLWATTQADLSCCGSNGPDDYYGLTGFSTTMPPNIPISCCPAYDSDLSDKAQEGLRVLCKRERQYYNTGCKFIINELYHQSADTIMISLYVLAALEFLTGVMSIIAGLRKKHNAQNDEPKEIDKDKS